MSTNNICFYKEVDKSNFLINCNAYMYSHLFWKYRLFSSFSECQDTCAQRQCAEKCKKIYMLNIAYSRI